jgi:hypothetical protein
MTTRDLIAILNKLDPSGNMEVIRTMHSDYGEMEPGEVSVIEAVKKSSAGYIMKTHHSMVKEDVAAIRKFIHFIGN